MVHIGADVPPGAYRMLAAIAERNKCQVHHVVEAVVMSFVRQQGNPADANPEPRKHASPAKPVPERQRALAPSSLEHADFCVTMYTEHRMSLESIALLTELSAMTVRNILVYKGIPIRGRGRLPADAYDVDTVTLEEASA